MALVGWADSTFLRLGWGLRPGRSAPRLSDGRRAALPTSPTPPAFVLNPTPQFNVFELKQVPRRRLIPLAAAYVGYIVLCNLNLNLNPVGFYQITKIVVAPAVLGIEALWYGRRSSSRVTMAVLVVCLGVALATVTDPQLSSNAVGLVVGFGSVAATALYQIWAGVMQRELGLGSMQLLHQYVPLATLMLGGLTVVAEPVGWGNPVRGTLLGYTPTTAAVVAILVSAALGLLVNLSTFLVIGATSSLTYNVVGHVKTVLILSGGVLFFGDAMPLKKAAGIGVAMLGIIWCVARGWEGLLVPALCRAARSPDPPSLAFSAL